eukprot:COSAG01_NODE_36880_length_511_cov_1.878641_1_plen_105_part_01
MSGYTPSQRLPRWIPVSLHAPLGWGGWARLGRLGQLANWTCTSRLKKRWKVKTPPRLLPFLLLPPRRRQRWQERSRHVMMLATARGVPAGGVTLTLLLLLPNAAC